MPHDTNERRIAIAAPTLGDDEWQAVREPITGGWLTQGPKVAEFERAFADRHGVEHAIATTNCTTAMHLVLTALEIGPGDEVIVPAFTWVATANVVLYCGATPVFADVDQATYNIDPASISAAITSRTKAIMAVHLFGLCADMDAIRLAAGDIPIVEDAACAAGASYQGRPAGAIGTAGCFSFHPRKTITTGEGGMITTTDGELAARVATLRNHGASVSEEVRHHGPQPYLLPDFNVLGFNYRMTDLQGAIGTVQLRKLDALIDERRRWAQFYSEQLAGVPWLRTPHAPANCDPSWQAYVCYVDESQSPGPRHEIMHRLQQCGISTRPGTHAVPTLGYYRDRFGFSAHDFPVARDCARCTMALPLHNQMTEEDYRYVVQVLWELAAGDSTNAAGRRASPAA